MKMNTTAWTRSAFRLGLALLLCLSVSSPVLAVGDDATQHSLCSMAVIYAVTALLSLLLVAAYCRFAPKKELWFLLLFVSVFVVNLGYFALAISETLEEAMLANRIAYLGSVFLPLCMLMIIMNVCTIRPGKVTMAVLVTISVLVFLLAASGGYLPWYYREVSLEHVGGVATLKKVYGPLHKLYFVYLFAYFGTMVGVIIYAQQKEKAVPQKYAAILAVLALWNIAVWFVEQLIDWEFEFLSVSYIVTELLLLLLYGMVQEYGALERPQTKKEPEDTWEDIPQLALLTAREKDVLRLMMENKKRKEIAEALFVTENTIKKHTAHIYEKLEVSSRSELILKLERK